MLSQATIIFCAIVVMQLVKQGGLTNPVVMYIDCNLHPPFSQRRTKKQQEKRVEQGFDGLYLNNMCYM